MSPFKLYQLTGEFRVIEDMLTESEGEFTPEIEQRALQLTEDLADKIEAYRAVRSNFLRSMELVQGEINRLQAEREKFSRAVDSIDEHIKHNLEAAGIEVAEGRIRGHKVRVQDSPARIVDWILEEVPAEFLTYHGPTLDRAAVMRSIRETGQIPPGVTIDKSRTHLRWY
jgi:hypothetical protein